MCLKRLFVRSYKLINRINICKTYMKYEKSFIDPRARKKLLKNSKVCCLLTSILFHKSSQIIPVMSRFMFSF